MLKSWLSMPTCLQVGARNMQNFSLLRKLAGSERPILLKRGPSATINEWLLAAEYLLAGGNPNVVLCERGIKTFETATRNTLDLAAHRPRETVDASAGDCRPIARHRLAKSGATDV